MRQHNGQRGSALLFTLLATVAGALIFGLAVDSLALLAAKARLRTMAELAAEAIRLERQAKPDAQPADLERAALALLAKNGLPRASVTLNDGVIVRNESEVYFLRVLRPQPVLIAARAEERP